MTTRRRNIPSQGGPLRIGFATPSLGRGGAERWILTLCKTFSKSVRVAGILTYDIGGCLASEARKLTRLFLPHETKGFFSSCDVVIAWGLLFSNTPDLSSFKGRIIACSHGAGKQPFHRRTNTDMAGIPGCILTAVSDSAAQSFPDGSSVTVIPNGVEPDRCLPRFGRQATRDALGIPDGVKVALFFGRLGKEKRPTLLADAIMGLTGWCGVFAGLDCDGQGDALPVDGKIIRLEPQDAPGDLLAAADCFVLPSDTEAHPLALTEAWLAGVPTVYCDWGFADQIRKTYGGDFGQVVPVETTPWDLGNAMLRSVSEPQRPWTDLAKRVAWRDFTSTAMAARWERFLGVKPNFRRVCKSREKA